MGIERYNDAVNELMPFGGGLSEYYDMHKIPRLTREPYNLPRLKIDDVPFQNYSFACYEVPDTPIGNLFNDLSGDSFTLENYQSHPSIKAPLSN